MLYQFQWGFRKAGRSLEEYMKWARKELRPTLKRMLDVCKQQDILLPQAVYGYWPANAEGNDVIVYDPEEPDREVARFTLPRQSSGGGRCVAAFPPDAASRERARRGLQQVPLG